MVMPPLLGRYKERMEGIQALMGQFRIPKHLRRQLRKWVVRDSQGPRGYWGGWCVARLCARENKEYRGLVTSL